jgi:signal transduction histidine kinase
MISEMNQKLQNILDIIQQSEKIDDEQKDNLIKAVKDADKELEITAFKLERTEKVKKTTAILLEETIEELEQKRKAVEAQNRDLEIEASLERVRTVAMGMNTSDDLLNICEVSFKEFKKLGFDNLRNAIIHILNDEKRFFLDYDYSDYLGGRITNINYNSHPFVEDYLRQIKKADDAFAQVVIESTELDGWKEFRRSGGQVDDPRLDETQSLYYYLFSIGVGDIGISTFNPIDDTQIKILKRFRNVFDLAYRRYNDIALAEVQAREAQIELALERVRARTMAMQSSNELKEVVLNMFDGLKSLGVDPTVCNISLMDKKTCDSDVWSAHQTDNGLITYRVFISHFEHPFRKKLIDSFLNKISFSVHELSGDLKKSYIQYLIDHVDYSKVPDEVTKSNEKLVNIEEGIVLSAAYMKYGLLIVSRSHAISNDESDILQRFAKIFEQTYTRFLDLQKAEAQAREAQIEASLEKVRAHTMGMQTSNDLSNVALVMFEQMKSLGGELFAFGIVLCDKQKDKVEQWHNLGNEGMISPFSVPVDLDYIHRYRYDQWKAGEELFSIEIPKDYIAHHFELMFELPSVKAAMDEVAAQGVQVEIPDWEIDYGASFRHGYLLVSSLKPFKEDYIFPRFAKVFDQAYTRFLDLKKAEAQAREAQIEAALERVRAKAMAMHSSDDISDTIGIVFKELPKLEINSLRCGVVLLSKDSYKGVFYAAATTNDSDSQIVVGEGDMSVHPIFMNQRENWTRNENYFITLRDEELKSYYQELFRRSSIHYNPKENDIKTEHGYYFYFSEGMFYAWSEEPYSESDINILKRFNAIIDLTFRRYFDLKKAEAQAREAQIEASLERLRAKSMSMQQSDELHEVLAVLCEQFDILDILPMSTHMTILDIENNKFTFRETGKFGNRSFGEHTFDLDAMDTWKDMVESWRNSEPFTINRLHFPKENLPQVWEVFHKSFASMPEESRITPDDYPDGIYHTAGKHPFGYIGMNQVRPATPEEEQIVIKFANEFGRAYQRFLDLQKAEAQAREAIKQAALDRVRGEIASMRTSDDLNRITPLIWRELKTLEVPFIRCGVFIVDEDKENVQVYLTTPDGKSLGVLNLSFDANELTSKTVEYWRQKLIYKEHWNKEEFINWTKSMMELGQVQNAETYQGSTVPPESLYLHFVPFPQGMLYVGDVSPLDDDKLALVKTLAEAFSIAYARYEDFKNIEEAKNKIEITLKELKSAQTQLIHSEKMASLGELTAGIAHEIKNPLNFVNNFSDLSRELIDELKDELQKNNNEEVLIILEDLKQNLDKINQHGKRADSIVKGMLLHSRGTSGEKTSTDINDLLEQYVNLAYHGMRAQNTEFNISIDRDYDKTLEKINVIPQDLSRAFLNIINNACYAAYDKKKKSIDNNFSPTLKVSTKNLNDKVEIRIGDNGNGIPANIIDKIFQPFFTTKPTGEGTGLGLSLSYDIVTKVHGGEIKLESEEGKYTEFIIELPKQ